RRPPPERRERCTAPRRLARSRLPLVRHPRLRPLGRTDMSCPILLIAPEIINPRSMPCVGLGYVGAYLASRGLPVRIVDAQYTKEDPLPVIRASEPTLVAVGVDSRTIERGLRIARAA